MERLYWEPGRLGCRRVIDLCDDCRKKRPDPESHGLAPVMKGLRTKEVPLNDILNLFLRIAPARFPGRIFGPCLGAYIGEEAFAFLGHLVFSRYDFGQSNVTQPDVFFSGSDTILMVEIKIDAKSNLLQTAKYALLAGLEENHSGQRKRLLLCYLTPEQPFGRIWGEGIGTPDDLAHAFRDYDPRRCGKPEIARMFEKHWAAYHAAASRLQFGFLTYKTFAARLLAERTTLDAAAFGDETLVRLIDGMHDELTARGLA
ncbi:MAG TPA: hypothetical protein VE914_04280 [Candidatus Angelobacter sp.]|nr:hypothetical protein [Candidatus Angelobacter sp.]